MPRKGKEIEEKNLPYEVKFKGLIEMCRQAKESKVQVVVIAHPEVLGDNYNEIVKSLNRISAAGLQLMIVPPDERGK